MKLQIEDKVRALVNSWLPAILVLMVGVPYVMWHANESLYDDLFHNDLRIQGKAMRELIQNPNDRMAEALLRYLKTPYIPDESYAGAENSQQFMRHDSMRATVLMVLARMGKKDAIDPTLMILKNETNIQLLGTTACALGLFKDPRIFTALLDAMSHKNEYVRARVIQALSRIEHQDVPSQLIYYLQHDQAPVVRKEAVIALVELLDTRAIHPLIKALENDRDEMRYHYVQALGELGGPDAEQALSKINQKQSDDDRMRKVTSYALDKIRYRRNSNVAKYKHNKRYENISGDMYGQCNTFIAYENESNNY